MTALSEVFGAGVARDRRLTGSVAGEIAGVVLAGVLLFRALLPRLRLSIPRIVQDVVVAVVCVVAVFGTATRIGLDLSGIVATGAVLTGVIGLALQDMLGNVFGGLGLQLDHTIRVGDMLTRSQVTVLGRRIGQARRWRRQLPFNIDFRFYADASDRHGAESDS